MNMESKEVSTPIKVAIGSKNPVKVNAALGGLILLIVSIE